MNKFLVLFFVVFLTSCKTVETQFPAGKSATVSENSEAREFYELTELEKKGKNLRTAEVLTYLLGDDDVEDPFTAVVIDNFSNCDIIVRIVEINGNEIYNLPISKGGKNYLKIRKGNYTLKAKMCSAQYYSQKQIVEPLILKLSEN
ncbi:DUF6759 domain-containing protein [Chryseobacterium sp.]|uniref:DUF6759 domain-containing protein n=1 Tax=Chryseobacterium sp. TaxID=1871047 RepID=UPI0011C79466|nr:DUF6759 domain-containing protein [Chryseobacterium sp.]TXF77189.1 hypothetical protein FUA25_04425 [Chryseobacterium sp.]